MAAAEESAAAVINLPRELVFVDLETTGGNAAFHRITEVGIVRMKDDRVVEEWSSLVNPECRIPAYVEAFTGITNEMVAGAPRFSELAALVLEKLRSPSAESPIFVAHNARFDYSFLRTEFRRLDVHFSAKVLCTVKLSRRLFPEYPRHNLDAVMERHRLTCTARHRALGDARVLGDFWSKLRRELSEERLAAAAQIVIGAGRLPAHLPAGLADELPEGPGVYRLFGEGDALLYVGRSHSLRSRILGHFATGNSDPGQQKKAQQTRRIDWVETAGELGAQLKEAEWIKTLKPIYNRRPKGRSEGFSWQAPAHGHGVELAALADLDCAALAGCYGVFQSRKDARKALADIARAHALCMKILGLETPEGAPATAGPAATERAAATAGPAAAAGPAATDRAAADGTCVDPRVERLEGSCVGYQFGRCKGACVGKEPLILHDMRLKMALSALKLKPWPFPGRVAIAEGRDEFHVLDHWAYLGTARSEDELLELRNATGCAAFDADVYRILVRFLMKNPDVIWHDLRSA
ncbi:MAG TPA: exonuclease domain-containing protein [Steroidobacteraceae bacterium]|nr:exonuclease domain-containing protein [Steroidobacteraceae bacterium]